MVTKDPQRRLTVVGSINMDLVGRVPHIPAAGETVMGTTLARHHGGKGANQAVAAARLGAAVSFFGAIGNDAFGAELAQGLAHEGIDTRGLAHVPAASGCALIAVSDDGENAISVLPGANLLAPQPPPSWPGGVLLMLQLEVPIATSLAWAKSARLAGATVMLNAAPFAALPAQLLEVVDILVVNEVEMAALERQAEADPATQAALAALGWRVVTRGAEGVTAWPADGSSAARLAIPAQPVSVVDTTGAGDTFCGAFAAGLVGGLAIDAALARANRAAGLACTSPGARGGMPTLHRLDQQ